METTKIKICGLRRPEDIEAVNKYLPEYVGFVFYKKSKRYVTEEQAEKLRELLDEKIISVGVFVNADKDEILRLMRKGIISVAQLHGNESEDYIKELKEILQKPGKFPDGKEFETGGKIIKVFVFKRPEAASDITINQRPEMNEDIHKNRTREINEYNLNNLIGEVLEEAERSSSDYILFDNGYGSGGAFDWTILEDFDKPFFLAGGLDPENVSEAIGKLKPYALDVSSGVETHGFKDAEKIRAFVDEVRRIKLH